MTCLNNGKKNLTLILKKQHVFQLNRFRAIIVHELVRTWFCMILGKMIEEVPQEEGRCMETRPQGAKAFDSVAIIRLSIEKANEWTKDIPNLDVWNVFDTVPHKLVRKYIMEEKVGPIMDGKVAPDVDMRRGVIQAPSESMDNQVPEVTAEPGLGTWTTRNFGILFLAARSFACCPKLMTSFCCRGTKPSDAG